MRFKFLPFLLLSACGVSHVDPNPPIQYVYCVTPDQYKKLVDAMPPKIGNTLDKDARKSNKQLVGQNVLVRRYADGLLTILGGCIGQPQQPAS